MVLVVYVFVVVWFVLLVDLSVGCSPLGCQSVAQAAYNRGRGGEDGRILLLCLFCLFLLLFLSQLQLQCLMDGWMDTIAIAVLIVAVVGGRGGSKAYKWRRL